MANIFTEPVTKEIFDYFLNNRIDNIKHVLGVKAKEYARNNDVLHNFNQGSKLTGESREKYNSGLVTKQIISVNDMIDDLVVGNYPSDAMIEEKFGDVINYFILNEISFKHRNMVRLGTSIKAVAPPPRPPADFLRKALGDRFDEFKEKSGYYAEVVDAVEQALRSK